jgi:fatty-acyl-CoA synthase
MSAAVEIRHFAWRASLEARGLRAAVRAGMLGPESPRTLVDIAGAVRAYGAFGSTSRIAALRHGDLPAIVDDRGQLTFAELDERVNRLAHALIAHGLRPGSGLGVLCGNHRQLLIAAFAAARGGLDLIMLNTSFSARQCAEVADRESVELLVYDAELAELAVDVRAPLGRLAVTLENPDADELDRVIEEGAATLPPAPTRAGRIVILTSGTTGTPKGAPRADPRGFAGVGAMLERMPMRAREATVVAPPLFHGTGLLIALLSLALGSKLVLRRRFDAAQVLDDIAGHRATAVCVVPIMLQRLLALGQHEIGARDLSALRIVFCAGSSLPPEVAIATMDALGEVVYNLYATTEVALATMATPADVRAAPTSVGRPLLGSRVRIRDEHGRQLPHGQTGRIFVGTLSPFEGYTGGGAKEIIDGMLFTGDLGHLDAAGRLFIDGRDDEMIISGGENVFPREIEELLLTHPSIRDAAVIGVADPEFGQRLRAFVVLHVDRPVSAPELQAFVKANLARYKVPRDVVFLDDLPRTPTGKVLKRQLAWITD